MSRSSIRQPLVVYAVVLALVISLGVLAFCGVGLSRAARRAYRRAVRQELHLFARSGLLPGADNPDAEVRLGLVTSSTRAFGLGRPEARAIVTNPNSAPHIVVVPFAGPSEEMYLVAALPRSVPVSIALVELSRIMPFVLLLALLAAAVMAFLVYRQLLPSLRALAELADEPRSTPSGLNRPDAPNEITEIALRFRDTTRMLRDARERAEAQRDELERMQSSLIRASKLASVGRLAAGIAHEIGNPLAAVKGYLSLIRDGLPEHDQAEALARSIRELSRIHAIIEKLLTYARTGSERQTASEPFELRSALSDAIGLVRGHAALRGVEIIDEVPDDGLRVRGQVDRLGQVLVNLLLNAGQATSGGKARQVRLTRAREGAEVTIEVSDSGPGVAQEHEEHLFEPFFTTKGPGEGTGLGLAVSRAMMETMGGTLELIADRPAGGPLSRSGATFAVRLPLEPNESAAAASVV